MFAHYVRIVIAFAIGEINILLLTVLPKKLASVGRVAPQLLADLNMSGILPWFQLPAGQENRRRPPPYVLSGVLLAGVSFCLFVKFD